MAANQTIDINLQSRISEDSACQPGTSLKIWQEPEEDDSVDLFDLKQMWAAARAGKSARTYKPYSSDVKMTEDTISFSIGFFVSTVPEDLDYELETGGIGTISFPTKTTVERNLTAVFGHSECVDMEGTISDLKYRWQTPLYDKAGVEHPILPITVDSGILFIDEPYFGVALVQFQLAVDHYKLYVELPLYDENGNPIKYDDLSLSITATYAEQNEDGDVIDLPETETLDIDIPEAVEAALEMCEGKPGLICYQCPSEWRLDIYYNTCNGKILDTHEVDPAEDDTWCLPADSGGRWGDLSGE